MKKDIHHYKERLDNAIERVKASNVISERNKQLIQEFLTHCKIEGLSLGRTARYGWVLLKLSEWLAKDFDQADRKDIESLVGKIQLNESYKDWTKHLYKVAIKKFYKWMNGGEEYPSTVRWIKCNFKNSDRILPEEILTGEEVKKMIELAEHPRDKAFIASLYESGCRIGEIGVLNMKHVVFDEYGAQIIVDGKTGMRRVRLIASVPYLTNWINNHPFRNDPEYPLWISIGTMNHGKQLSYTSFVSLLKNIAIKAGITKRVNPHSWRKARATHVAPNLKELVMDMHFGWVLGSKMPRIYVHLSGRDVDNSLLELYGMKKKDEKTSDPIAPKICQVCQHVNETTSRFCNKCARPLELKTMLELEEKRTKDETLVVKLLETPGMLEYLVSNADEGNIRQLMETHPNLTARISTIVMKNLRR